MTRELTVPVKEIRVPTVNAMEFVLTQMKATFMDMQFGATFLKALAARKVA